MGWKSAPSNVTAPRPLVILLLTSLSPWTVICFFRDALSLKILAHESKWHLNVLAAGAPPTLLPGYPVGRFAIIAAAVAAVAEVVTFPPSPPVGAAVA